MAEVVSLGFYRGIINQLDEIEASEPPCAPFVREMRQLARQFQFESMGQQLNKVIHEN